MLILAADTALGACSVAILENGNVRAKALEAMERGHAEALAPMVETLMRKAGLSFAQINRLAVTTGPGTFTGQRVGLAFMRGLRIALKKPLVGVTTLEAMAAQTLHESNLETAAVLHDARRGEVYLTIVSRGTTVVAPCVLPFDEAVGRIARCAPAGIALAGTAAAPANEALRKLGIAAHVVAIPYPDAEWVARLAAACPEPDRAPDPLYLRPADAKLPSA